MIIEYNETNIFDLVRVLRVIMRQILLYDEYLDTNDRYMTKVVSSKNLVSYEKGSKYYKFNYTDHTEVMDSRTAKKLLSSRDMMGFVDVNNKDVINMMYFECHNENGVLIDHRKDAIHLSRNGRHSLEKYLNLW